MRILSYLFLIIINLIGLQALADSTKFLPADEAFQVSAQSIDQQDGIVKWKIAPGYHLYSDSLDIKPTKPNNIKLAPLQLPQGKAGSDPSRGNYMEYYRQLEVPIHVVQGSTTNLELKVSYQGCADAGICYPPKTKVLQLSSGNNNNFDQLLQESSDVHSINHLFENQSASLVLFSFFVFGLLLALTPCVFPMLPILSSILANQGEHITSMRAFLISLAYVLSSALTYAIAGIFAGLAGEHVQVLLQNPWVIIVSGLLFILLSLSLFGLYELQLPSWLQSKLTHLSHQKKHGPLVSAALMGIFSTLIVSPCVSAPLVGALAYIGGTGSAWLGGSALFMLGLGMGLPLLIIGSSAGKILPKAGAWMGGVKNFFGFILIAMAIWLWSRIIPGSVAMGLWGALAIFYAVFLGALDRTEIGWPRFWKALGIIIGVYGLSLLVGAIAGGSDLRNPFEKFSSASAACLANDTTSSKTFTKISTLAEIDLLRQKHQPMLIDFYAGWCVACHEMEREVFDSPQFKEATMHYNLQLVKVDLTDETADNKAILARYHLFAPPVILLFNAKGELQENLSMIGAQSLDTVLKNIQQIK
ncbi:MAG: Cytochrome c biosis protein transrane region [Gammaproteobacteria bacterium]|jgi:thiol:disulfide interchange protein DsbD|nr:Cytochrome c biosis protein transrane region [Gammaproteobacteria bacterium]